MRPVLACCPVLVCHWYPGHFVRGNFAIPFCQIYQKAKQVHKYFSFMEAKKPCLPFSPDIPFTAIQCDSNCRGYTGMFSVRQIFSFFQYLRSSFGYSSILISHLIIVTFTFSFVFIYILQVATRTKSIKKISHICTVHGRRQPRI